MEIKGYNFFVYSISQKRLFDAIQSLNLPIGEYVIMGSAALAALGIREYKDIDILVSTTTFHHLINKGWKRQKKWPNCLISPDGVFEATISLWTSFPVTIETILPKAVYFENIPFCSLEDLLNIKNDLKREKDKKDVELINSLSQRSNIFLN